MNCSQSLPHRHHEPSSWAQFIGGPCAPSLWPPMPPPHFPCPRSHFFENFPYKIKDGIGYDHTHQISWEHCNKVKFAANSTIRWGLACLFKIPHTTKLLKPFFFKNKTENWSIFKPLSHFSYDLISCQRQRRARQIIAKIVGKEEGIAHQYLEPGDTSHESLVLRLSST